MNSLAINWVLISFSLGMGWALRALICEHPPADPQPGRGTPAFTYDAKGRLIVLPPREVLEREAHHNQN